jgi:hypothetical protein
VALRASTVESRFEASQQQLGFFFAPVEAENLPR